MFSEELALTERPSRPRPGVNPFSTRYVAALDFQWIAGDWNGGRQMERLAEKFLVGCRSRAAIVGPHGSGKTSLLRNLLPLLGELTVENQLGNGKAKFELTSCNQLTPERGASYELLFWRLRSNESNQYSSVSLKINGWQRQTLNRDGGKCLLVIDGFEQLSNYRRTILCWTACRRKLPLLVTSHRRTYLPSLLETQTSPELVLSLLDQLGQTTRVAIPSRFYDPNLIEQTLSEEHGNIRELFMRFYDIYHSEYEGGS